ncbi:MAG TPA: hypothetical protein VK203_04250, partial [Nostocaceae cyanobacterium]|nr:hypothetical protein [Nostocaceae cyanobacterium]
MASFKRRIYEHTVLIIKMRSPLLEHDELLGLRYQLFIVVVLMSLQEVYLLRSKFRVLGWKCQALGSKCRALGSEFQALGSKCRALGSEFQALGSKFRALGSKFRAKSSGFQALGSEFQALG